MGTDSHGKKKKKKKRDAKDAEDSTSTQSKPKLRRKQYEEELEKLQVELVKLQSWVKHTGARIVVVFEGRDAAG